MKADDIGSGSVTGRVSASHASTSTFAADSTLILTALSEMPGLRLIASSGFAASSTAMDGSSPIACDRLGSRSRQGPRSLS